MFWFPIQPYIALAYSMQVRDWLYTYRLYWKQHMIFIPRIFKISFETAFWIRNWQVEKDKLDLFKFCGSSINLN